MDEDAVLDAALDAAARAPSETLRSGSVPGIDGDPWEQRALHRRIAAEIASEPMIVDRRPWWER